MIGITLRRLLSAGTCTLLATALLTAIPPAANAALGIDADCAGERTIRFSPPLTDDPQTVELSYTDQLTCVVYQGSATGTASRTFTLDDLSCLTPLYSSPGTTRFNWGDGAISDFTFIAVTVGTIAGAATILVGGIGSAGRYGGDTATETIGTPVVPFPSNCVTGGISQATSALQLNITRLTARS